MCVCVCIFAYIYIYCIYIYICMYIYYMYIYMALSWTLFLIETKTGRDYLDALLMEGRGDAYGYGNTTCLFFNLSRSLTNRTYSSKERTIYMACVSLATCPTNSTESRVTESVGWRCALLTQTWRWTKSCHDL